MFYIHSKAFHLDDVLCASMAKLMGLQYLRTEIFPENFSENDIMADMGREYNPQRHIFDHHQSFIFPSNVKNSIRKNIKYPYASAGLIWHHYHNEIIYAIIKNTEYNKRIFISIDKKIIRNSDCIDNGFELDKIKNYTLADAISAINPLYKNNDNINNHHFDYAVGFVSTILRNEILKEFEKIKSESYLDSCKIINNGTCLEINEFHHWKDYICSNKRFKDILYVIFPSQRGGWRIQCVPKTPSSFLCRKNLPKNWRANIKIMQKDIGATENLNDSSWFCHLTGFLGGAPTKEMVIKIAEMAIFYKK